MDNIDPPDFEYNGRNFNAYEATQMQRKYERTIRQTKREIAMYEAAGETAELAASKARLANLNGQYTAFSKAAGLPRQMERLSVRGMPNLVLPQGAGSGIITAGGKVRMANTHLTTQIKIGEHEWIPRGTEITNVNTIAGRGTSKIINVANRLSDRYGGEPGGWMKQVGKIQSDKFEFDIHWYEHSDVGQFDFKIKNYKERRRV